MEMEKLSLLERIINLGNESKYEEQVNLFLKETSTIMSAVLTGKGKENNNMTDLEKNIGIINILETLVDTSSATATPNAHIECEHCNDIFYRIDSKVYNEAGKEIAFYEARDLSKGKKVDICHICKVRHPEAIVELKDKSPVWGVSYIYM